MKFVEQSQFVVGNSNDRDSGSVTRRFINRASNKLKQEYAWWHTKPCSLCKQMKQHQQLFLCLSKNRKPSTLSVDPRAFPSQKIKKLISTMLTQLKSFGISQDISKWFQSNHVPLMPQVTVYHAMFSKIQESIDCTIRDLSSSILIMKQRNVIYESKTSRANGKLLVHSYV